MQLHGSRSICTPQRKGRSLALLIMIFLTCFTQSLRAEAICAEVVMEIPQRVSMERQAFNAKLGINNGISDAVAKKNGHATFANQIKKPGQKPGH